jgi:hypothetical protein
MLSAGMPTGAGEVTMPEMQEFIDDLKTARDEARLQIHLGSKEAQDEWAAIEKRWHTFKTKVSWKRARASWGARSGSSGPS